jgi:hypothetical protein
MPGEIDALLRAVIVSSVSKPQPAAVRPKNQGEPPPDPELAVVRVWLVSQSRKPS